MIKTRLSFLKRKQHGSSLIEYAIILAVLGGTSAVLIFSFGQRLIDFIVETEIVITKNQEYAKTQGNPFLELNESFIPDATNGQPYTHNIAPNLRSIGFLPGAPDPTWSLGPLGTGLPNGLTLNPQTGQINGTPTQTGLFAFEINVQRQEAFAIEEYLLLVTP